MSLKVLLADDHWAVLDGLKALLSLEVGLEVLGACTNGIEVLASVERQVPDVIVMDAEMPRCGGLDTHDRLRESGLIIPTVILSANLDDSEILRCLASDVNGIVLKESAPAVLIEAIRTVAAGDRWIPRELAARAAAQNRRFGAWDELTTREREVTEHAAGGQSNKGIATALGIAESTVKIHLHHAFKKLGVQNRVQLSLLARHRAER